MNSVRYGILHAAIGPSPLWELPMWSTVEAGHRVVHPSRSVAEIRPELIVLLAESHVEVYDRSRSVSSALEPDSAAAIVEDDGNWMAPVSAGRQNSYVVVLTDSGVEEYERLLRTRG